LDGLNIGFVFFIAFVKESDFKANIVASFLSFVEEYPGIYSKGLKAMIKL
jgi:hypothetical protein